MPQLGSQILTGIIRVECFLKMFSPREKSQGRRCPQSHLYNRNHSRTNSCQHRISRSKNKRLHSKITCKYRRIAIIMSKNIPNTPFSFHILLPKHPQNLLWKIKVFPNNKSTNHFKEFFQFPQSHKSPEASNTAHTVKFQDSGC